MSKGRPRGFALPRWYNGSMYEICVAVSFHAAHFLREYEGKCAHLHGHTWRVKAAVSGDSLSHAGMVMDFHDLKALLEKTVALLDHACLNDLEPFDHASPTSENIARHVYGALKEGLGSSAPGVRLSWVSVSESPDTEVIYREG